MKLAGGCHCGQVRFSVQVSNVPVMLDCNCSICAKTGYIHLIVPHDEFRLEHGGDALVSYRFGSGQAEHLFCKTCSIKSFYQPRSHPDCWSVNARCLDGGVPADFRIEKFDGRNWDRARQQLADKQK